MDIDRPGGDESLCFSDIFPVVFYYKCWKSNFEPSINLEDETCTKSPFAFIYISIY